MIADQPPAFVCTVVSLHDADGPIRCCNGVKIRVAGVNSREVDGTCRRNAPCPVMRHEQAKPIAERLVLRKMLTCQPVDRSYRWIVAVCSFTGFDHKRGKVGQIELSCALIASGAAVKWPSYWRRYGMGECR